MSCAIRALDDLLEWGSQATYRLAGATSQRQPRLHSKSANRSIEYPLDIKGVSNCAVEVEGFKYYLVPPAHPFPRFITILSYNLVT